MKLLLGTTNPAKIADYKKYLVRSNLDLVTPQEIGLLEEPLEIGETFFDNALQKAKFYAEKTELPTLSDDGGFEVDALDGGPGVNSNRWLGPSATEEKKMNKILELLTGTPLEKRTARLKFVTVVYFPDVKDYVQVEGSVEGVIPQEASIKRIKGFPYSPILYLPEFKKILIDLTEEERNNTDHRKKACKELLLKLEPYLNT